ncbi:MAG: hypothetical protein ACYDCC_01140 [Actinomycetota bacterium]
MRTRIALIVSVLMLCGIAGMPARATSGFEVGAATTDMTPPAFDANHHTPAIDPAGFTGARRWDFEEPYVDVNGTGQWAVGDPYIDRNHDARYDGIWLAGGGRDPLEPTKVADPVTARAFVVDNGSKAVAVEVLDTIGMFSDDMDLIRARVRSVLGDHAIDVKDIFISSTHDESAPDVIGLWGPGLTPAGEGILNSGVNEYWMQYAISQAADAIINAYRSRRPATIRYAESIQPSNFLTCWSSYPYVRGSKIPVMQAVGDDGNVIFTMINYGIHAETLAFNPITEQKYWISADWPYWARTALEQHYGGVGIQMAGMVGSVETPKVFQGGSVSAAPTGWNDPGHPAGCRTVFSTTGTPVPIGYYDETRAVGTSIATQVINALDTSAEVSTSNDIATTRNTFFIPLTNSLFIAAGAGQVFPRRPLYVNGVELPEATGVLAHPIGSLLRLHGPHPDTNGVEVRTQVVAYRIGDGEFLSTPGETFPFTLIRGFQGPQDMPYPNDPMSAFVSPHFSQKYRFIEGLGEDMIGYIFPKANAVGIPGDRPSDTTTRFSPPANYDDTDRFGCGHSDDSESVAGVAGNIVADQSVAALDSIGRSKDEVLVGRWVWPDGTLHRSPLGDGTLGCSASTSGFVAAPGSPIAVRVFDGDHPRTISLGSDAVGFVDYNGFDQSAPTVDTRGVRLADGRALFLDVYPDVNP